MVKPYYTTMIFIVVSSVIPLLLMIHRSSPLNRHDIFCFTLAFIMIALCAALECAQVQLDGRFPRMRPLHFFVVFTEFALSPLIPALFSYTIRPSRFSRWLMAVPAINFIFLLINIKTGIVYSVDLENVYHRGTVTFLYPLFLAISILCMFVCLAFLNRDYYSSNGAVIISIIIIMAAGLTVQIINRELLIDWVVIYFAAVMIYDFYSSLVSMTDELTHLLNRNAFQNDSKHLNKCAYIAYFDIDGFKDINDNLGHNYGDSVLRIFAAKACKVYGLYGKIYRVGGDELCAIITKKGAPIDKLNDRLRREAESALNRGKDAPSVTVSVGYEFFDPAKSTFAEALAEADRKMYLDKQQKKDLTE
ncbi:MAG: GGDEF domain-containing protein [Clostridia bacterium]|nr:GGDEF domain-containing protein [Clostridia bacterium]